MRKQLSEDLADISSDTFYLFIFLQNLKPIYKKVCVAAVLASLPFPSSFLFACDYNFLV